MRRVSPRSSQTVTRDSVERKRRSWLMRTSAAAPAVELAFQPLDGGEVEMVGRLVEQQDIRLRRQRARQRCAAGLAAGEMRRVFAAGQPELVEQRLRRVNVVGRRQAGFDVSERGREPREVRLLRQIAHQRARLHENRAAVGLDQPGRDLEQGRFARAVAADQRHALAGRDRQLRAGQQRRAAEGERDVFELQKRRSHVAMLCDLSCDLPPRPSRCDPARQQDAFADGVKLTRACNRQTARPPKTRAELASGDSCNRR